jgi:benzodiazapine receptor
MQNQQVSRAGRDALALLGWLAMTIAASATSVFLSTSDGWYAGLVKPTWNPPGWLFGPVWTLLYTMVAVAA